MSDLKLNTSTWDLQITNGDLVLIEDKEALSQYLRQRLQTFLGEWFLNVEEGIPYFQEVMSKGTGLEAISSIFKKAILETAGVQGLESFEIDFDPVNRTLELEFAAQSVAGVINFNEVIDI